MYDVILSENTIEVNKIEIRLNYNLKVKTILHYKN